MPNVKSLYIDREWEMKCIDKICSEIRNDFPYMNKETER